MTIAYFDWCCLLFDVMLRNIGRLARSIRTRKHPAINLINQYMRAISASTNRSHTDESIMEEEEEVEEEEADVNERQMKDDSESNHPLIPLGSVSSTSTADMIIFPKTTRWTHKLMYVDWKNTSHFRQRVLEPTLGEKACEFGVSNYNGFQWKQVYLKTVQAGMWRYSCSEKENKSTVERLSISSWFSMEIQYLPHQLNNGRLYTLRHVHPTTIIYGRFHHFVELCLPEWTHAKASTIHHLGNCTLYESTPYISEVTGLQCINLTTPIKVWLQDTFRTESYINLKHIQTQVAIAPVIHRIGKDLLPSAHQFVMLPMQK